MARDAQERAAAQNESYSSDANSQSEEQNRADRRETLLEQTTPTLRIWELNDLTKIEKWTEQQKQAALEIQKQVMEDYT